MLHAVWRDGLVIFGWRSRVLDQKTVLSLASTLFVQERSFTARPLQLAIPGRNGWLEVTGFDVSIATAADAFQLRDWVPWRSLSPSLAWFARAARLGRDVATSGLVIPGLTLNDGRAVAGWQPVVTDAVGKELAFLANGLPPVVAALHPQLEPWQLALTTVTAFADDAARTRLRNVELPDPAPGSRRSADVVARRFLGALTGPDNEMVLRGPQDHAAARDLTVTIERWTASSTGRSPLTGLETILRVVAPEDVDVDVDHDDEALWLVELLLAPKSDPSRLVAAADVWSGKGSELLDLDPADATAAVQVVARRISQFAPSLAAGFATTTPSGVTLDLGGLLQFLQGEAAQLEKRGIRVLLPTWWGTTATARILGKARTPTEPDIVAGGLDVQSIAQIDWSLALDGEPLSTAEIAKLAAAKHELVYLRGKWVGFNEDRVRHALTALTRQRREQAVLSPLELLKVSADPSIEFDAEGWAAELLAGLPDDRMKQMAEPAGFVGTLRHYQQRGLGWLAFLHRLGLGGVLADDMGLGKTAQLLALIAHAGGGPTLVICPLSVVRNWESETARFTPSVTVQVHHGPDRATDAAELSADLVVTTYATATRDVALLSRIPWQRLVADEAQHVKNPQTGAARALRKIGARQKLALTGTPVENRLSELWSIIDLVNPGLLGSATAFRERFAVPIERHRNPEVTGQLRQLIQPFLLRRSKADPTLVPELPPKVEQVAWATLTREQAGLYQSVVDVLLTRLDAMKGGSRGNTIDRRGAILAALTALKQICNHPANYLHDNSRIDGRSGKLARFDELVTDVLDAEERLLVFTQYREMGELLTRHLRERLGVGVPFLHGGVTRARRDAMVDTFQSGTAGPILLVSLKAGGSGLNLTAASQVVHYDRWWNPAVENQASDRAWRIGQTRSVFVHKLVCQGTVEERIDQLIESKKSLAESVLSTSEGWITELSTDEIRDLISLRDHRP